MKLKYTLQYMQQVTLVVTSMQHSGQVRDQVDRVDKF